MLVRRLRGVLVAAAIWGFTFWGLAAAFILGMLILGADNPTPILRDILDAARPSLTMGGGSGALFAIILSALERKRSLTTISKARVGGWGCLAGLLTALAFRAAEGRGSGPLLAWHNVYFVVSLAGTSWFLAGAMLDMARRAESVSLDARAPVST